MHVIGGRMSRMASPALLFRLRRVVDEQRIQGRENEQGGGLTSQEPAQDGPASGAFASLPRSSTEQGRFSRAQWTRSRRCVNRSQAGKAVNENQQTAQGYKGVPAEIRIDYFLDVRYFAPAHSAGASFQRAHTFAHQVFGRESRNRSVPLVRGGNLLLSEE